MNLSTHPKFDKGTLVACDYFNAVGVVEAHRNDAAGDVETCVAYWRNGRSAGYWFEDADLRKPTFGEFALFRHPETGQWRIGMNPAWPFWYGLVIGSLCSYSAFHWHATTKGWEWSGSLPLALLLAWYAIGTLRNSKGKQA